MIGGWAQFDLNGPVLSTVEKYNPKTNSWRRRASMPTERAGLSASVVDDLIYLIGGSHYAIGIFGYSRLERYDPVKNKWKTLAELPTGRWGLATSAVNGKVYAFGGTGSQTQIYRNVDEYNTASNTWRSRAKLSQETWGAAGAVVDGQVYVIGGSTERGVGHNSLTTSRQYTP